MISLLSASATVRFAAAETLLLLSNQPSALKAAIACFLELCLKESDPTVKMVVLGRVEEALKGGRGGDEVWDLLRVLGASDLGVRRKALEMAVVMITGRNVVQVLEVLRKEMEKSRDLEVDRTEEWRKDLIKAVHSCALAYPTVAEKAVNVLLDFHDASDVSVIVFVKEVLQRSPQLRTDICGRVLESLGGMKTSKGVRGALWMLGEYCGGAMVEKCMEAILEGMGGAVEDAPEEEKGASSARKVLADGTYATETIYSSAIPTSKLHPHKSLRALLFAGDFYAMTVLATTLTKLSLRFENESGSCAAVNTFKTQAMLILTNVVRAGKGGIDQGIDEDSYSRIITCIRVLSSKKEKAMVETFLSDTGIAFGKMIGGREEKKVKGIRSQADDVVPFRLLKRDEAGEKDDGDFKKATKGEEEDVYVNKLDRIFPLTGYSDAVYVEAYIIVHQFDILLGKLLD